MQQPRLHAPASSIIPARLVHCVREPRSIGAVGTGGGHEPQINVIRDGDAVRAIEVVCACGERIMLDCVYPEGAAAPHPSDDRPLIPTLRVPLPRDRAA